MTRMLVQLRRVVYLLVLLQCCVCVVIAGDNVGTHLSHERRFEEAKQRAKEWAKDEEKALSEVKGCLTVLQSEVESWGANSLLAKNVVEKTKDLHGEVSAKVKPNVTSSSEEMEKLLKRALTTVQETKDADVKYLSFYFRIIEVNRLCSATFDNMVILVNDFNGTRNRCTGVFEEENKRKTTAERGDLIGDSNTRYTEFCNLTKYFYTFENKSKDWESQKNIREAKTNMQFAVDGLQKVVDQFNRNKNTKSFEKELNELKALIDSLWSTAAEIKERNIVKDIQGKVNEAQGKRIQSIVEVKKEREKESLEKEVQTQSTGEKKVEKKNAEQAEGSGDKKEKGVQTQKAGGVEGKKEDEKQDQSTGEKQVKKKNAEQAEGAGDKKETEGQTQKAGEGEKKRFEGELLVGKVEAIMDSSSSPVILHSPLLLLLMCVLGYILVC